MKFFKIYFIILLTISLSTHSQTRVNYRLPDIPGYITLKGDFHIHTPFSDGSVWPSDRVAEAWRDGLDVIAITDHVEYSPNNKDVSNNLNRPYEIALTEAEKYGIILIKGAEITRNMPPGHFNALFLNDVNALKNDDLYEAYRAAYSQGAFFVWNHPGWKAQQPDFTKWWPLHTEFLNKGWLQGIEIFNEKEYYPIVLQWAKEKKLTIFANSDIHRPIDFIYKTNGNERRPVTLVFAKERNVESIKEAFMLQHTAALFNDTVAGYAETLEPFIESCLKFNKTNAEINLRNEINIVLINDSDLPLALSGISNDSIILPDKIYIDANSSELLKIKFIQLPDKYLTDINLKFKVLNTLLMPEQHLEISKKISVLRIPVPEIKNITSSVWKAVLPETQSGFNFHISTASDDNTIKNSKNTIEFKSDDSITLNIAVFKNEQKAGETKSLKFLLHKALSANVKLNVQPSIKYFSNGAMGLVDGLTGNELYSEGNWLGFEGQSPEILIELTESTDIKQVALRFLENNHSWIFLPQNVIILTSTDGNQFQQYGKIKISETMKESNKGIVSFKIGANKKNVKFIKIVITCLTKCPDWHTGNGKPCWVFCDEIIVR